MMAAYSSLSYIEPESPLVSRTALFDASCGICT